MKKLSLSLLMLVYSLMAVAKDEQARMMVHLLDYIAVDYSMAVQNGEVISQAEYQEMKEFAQTVTEMGKNTSASLQSDMILLKELIDDKASQEKISSVASGIKQNLISQYQLEIAPKRWPSLKNGQELFALHCASCHGDQGRGDGSLAAGLEPAPTNFHSEDKANGLSPFQAYNTIRLGVENTGMRAFNELSDDEVWDLAFYVLSLPYVNKDVDIEKIDDRLPKEIDLETLASKDNQELTAQWNLNGNREEVIAALRLHPKEVAEKSEGGYLDKAKRMLNKALLAYQEGKAEEARNLALAAYLEGVEPIEVQLRASNASFVADLENQLARMRSSIEREKDVSIVKAETETSIAMLDEAQVIMEEKEFSGWLSFLLSFSIIFREGLEAFLVIITILGIIRAMKMPQAAKWVHTGWISAIGMGFLLWLAADRFFTFTGAQREVMEGVIALFAVGVLLYVGFWMHSKSEAGRWQAYVKSKIQVLARKENMLGLAFLSFLVVFREAFESVLFLSALSLEVGENHQMAFGGGIVTAFVLLGILSVVMLKYSKKLPIPQLFKYSALVISFLAVILMGKGVSAIQEAGMVTITPFPVNLRLSLLGIYPTWETILSQVFIIGLIIVLWNLGNRVMKKPICETRKEGLQAQESKLSTERV